MKKRIWISVSIILVVLIAAIIKISLFGSPWNSNKHQKAMLEHLKNTYGIEFVVEGVYYNPLSETYVGQAYPKEKRNVRFEISQDYDRKDQYKDKYVFAYWSDQIESEVTPKINTIFGSDIEIHADVQLNEMGDTSTRVPIPNFKDVKNEYIAFVVEIRHKENWKESMKAVTQQKIGVLSSYFKEEKLPLNAAVIFGKDGQDGYQDFYLRADGTTFTKSKK